jgi:hypothetical protein
MEFEIIYSYIEHSFKCLSTLTTSGGRLVSLVRSRTKATELLFVITFWLVQIKIITLYFVFWTLVVAFPVFLSWRTAGVGLE